MLNFVALLLTLEAGWMPNYATAVGMSGYVSENNYYVHFELEATAYDTFFVRYENTVLTEKATSFMFKPLVEDYKFAMGVKFDNVEIGVEHQCIHPVETLLYGGYEAELRLTGGYNKAYIKATFEMGGN